MSGISIQFKRNFQEGLKNGWKNYSTKGWWQSTLEGAGNGVANTYDPRQRLTEDWKKEIKENKNTNNYNQLTQKIRNDIWLNNSQKFILMQEITIVQIKVIIKVTSLRNNSTPTIERVQYPKNKR